MTKKSHSYAVAYIARVGVLSAVAAVLMYFPTIKLPFMPSFLTLDFSDFPALLASYALGPVAGVLVCLIKNLIHMPASSTAMIGELSNFLLGVFFVVPAGMLYKQRKTFQGAITSSVAGASTAAFLGIYSNLLIIYPLYYKYVVPKPVILGMYKSILPSVDSISSGLLIFNTPFIFCKGLISVLIVFLIYKKISPFFKIKK